MSQVHINKKLIDLLTNPGLMKENPFHLVDVGCSGGIDEEWKQLGDWLRAWGLDPQRSEIERLNAQEQHPGVEYHAYFVGREDSEYGIQKSGVHNPNYFNPFRRFSSISAQEWLESRRERSEARVQSNPINENHTDQWIELPAFIRQRDLDYVDFVKIDTDGNDYEVLRSLGPMFVEKSVLGVKIEANFYGSHHENQNTFSNVDRFMREHGFQLFDISVTRYSRSALPAPFRYDIFAQTISGQPTQGDFVYLRDAGSPYYDEIWKTPLEVTEILKIVLLFSMFRLPDCAAEVLLKHRDKIEPLMVVEELLDALVPQASEQGLTFASYAREFEEAPDSWMPGKISVERMQSWRELAAAEDTGLLQQLNDARREIRLMRESRSWKITAPLRRLFAALRMN